MLHARTRAAGTLLSITMLAACAAQVPVTATALAPLATPAPELLVEADVPVRLSTGYTRTIPRQSRWRAAGTVPQGIVYQPLNTVFAIEGRQVHEAWLVIRDGMLQGFYLPAENNFSPVAPALSLPLAKGAQR